LKTDVILKGPDNDEWDNHEGGPVTVDCYYDENWDSKKGVEGVPFTNAAAGTFLPVSIVKPESPGDYLTLLISGIVFTCIGPAMCILICIFVVCFKTAQAAADCECPSMPSPRRNTSKSRTPPASSPRKTNSKSTTTSPRKTNSKPKTTGLKIDSEPEEINLKSKRASSTPPPEAPHEDGPDIERDTDSKKTDETMPKLKETNSAPSPKKTQPHSEKTEIHRKDLPPQKIIPKSISKDGEDSVSEAKPVAP
jgi:hypothetical protein